MVLFWIFFSRKLRKGFISSLIVFRPVSENMLNSWAVRQLEYFFEIFFDNLEGFCRYIENIFLNELAEVDRSLLNLFQQEAAERLDAGA